MGIPDLWILAKNEDNAKRVLANWMYNELESQGELEDEDIIDMDPGGDGP